MPQAALWWQRWLGKEQVPLSEGKSPPSHRPKPVDPLAPKDTIPLVTSAVWDEVLPHAVSHWISRKQTRSGGQLLLVLVFYLVEDGKHASREFVLASQYTAVCTLHPAENCCSNNGKRKGGRDELRARSTPKPKHTLQSFLLQWDTRVKPSQCSVSLKTHTPASISPHQTLTEQRHISSSKAPSRGEARGVEYVAPRKT